VASSLDPQVCKDIADEINSQNRAISGFVRRIDVASVANRTVITLEQIMLD
jgi:hypothetical protein